MFLKNPSKLLTRTFINVLSETRQKNFVFQMNDSLFTFNEKMEIHDAISIISILTGGEETRISFNFVFAVW